MANPWTVHPGWDSAALRTAHERVIEGRDRVFDVRQIVWDSWQRAMREALSPDRATADLVLAESELRSYREQHVLASILPTIKRLLVAHTVQAGLIVAVGDAGGRLLWVDGDRDVRRRAEDMLFVEGADWSERTVGTSAPGTALVLDHSVQITEAEHFTRSAHDWSCTAVPIHDPADGRVIGVLDITGGGDAVAPVTLPLLEATVTAVENELRLQSSRARRRPAPAAAEAVTLRVLGHQQPSLSFAGGLVRLSQRHAEILTLLAWNPNGLSGDRLSDLVYGATGSSVTLRPELVRLRRSLPDQVQLLTKPYRLNRPIDLDARNTLALLSRGAHRAALAAYPGPVLPKSQAPGVIAIRSEVAALLREALLADAAVDAVYAYAKTDDGLFDREVWRTLLNLLPGRSPKRSEVVTRIEHIDRELGLGAV